MKCERDDGVGERRNNAKEKRSEREQHLLVKAQSDKGAQSGDLPRAAQLTCVDFSAQNKAAT